MNTRVTNLFTAKVARVIILNRLFLRREFEVLSTGIINILIQDNTYKIKNWNVIQTHIITWLHINMTSSMASIRLKNSHHDGIIHAKKDVTHANRVIALCSEREPAEWKAAKLKSLQIGGVNPLLKSDNTAWMSTPHWFPIWWL